MNRYIYLGLWKKQDFEIPLLSFQVLRGWRALNCRWWLLASSIYTAAYLGLASSVLSSMPHGLLPTCHIGSCDLLPIN